MTQKLLRESASTLAKSGKRWKGILAQAGQGSSGFYTEEVLREYGPKALAPGAHAYVDHPTEANPTRSPKDLIGFYPDGAVYEEGVGLVGELEIFPHWADFVEAVAPHTGLSIYMMGESDDEGNVTSLLPDPQNSVDLVSYAGLKNSGLVEKLYESARAASPKPPAASADRKTQKEGMNVELEKAIADLSAKFDASIAESKAALKVAEDAKIKAEADAKAALDAIDEKVKEALGTYKEKATAIEAAELLPEQSEPLLEAASNGEDITARLAEAVKVATAFKQIAETSGGFARAGESATGDASASLPKGW